MAVTERIRVEQVVQVAAEPEVVAQIRLERQEPPTREEAEVALQATSMAPMAVQASSLFHTQPTALMVYLTAQQAAI